MSDARWLDVEADIAAAAGHFRNAAALHGMGGFDAAGLNGYRARMAFMHAMQAGHTSLESGFVRLLELLDEERPTGAQWHADLIRRIARPRPGVRPALLSLELASFADETRRFRSVALHAYDSFRAPEASQAVEAGLQLADALPSALGAFRDAIDP